jgi:hypothetical protein
VVHAAIFTACWNCRSRINEYKFEVPPQTSALLYRGNLLSFYRIVCDCFHYCLCPLSSPAPPLPLPAPPPPHPLHMSPPVCLLRLQKSSVNLHSFEYSVCVCVCVCACACALRTVRLFSLGPCRTNTSPQLHEFRSIKLSHRTTFYVLESSWNVMAHGDAREGKWRGNWRMEWVASTVRTTSEHCVYAALLPLMRTTRLPVVDWTDAPADLNGLVRFAEKRNVVSARVPSHFTRSLQHTCLVVWKGVPVTGVFDKCTSNTALCTTVTKFIRQVYVKQIHVVGYTWHKLTWSLWTCSHYSWTWPLDELKGTDSAHVQKIFVCLSRINELWERCNTSRRHKSTADSFEICHHLPTIVLTLAADRCWHKRTVPTIWQIFTSGKHLWDRGCRQCSPHIAVRLQKLIVAYLLDIFSFLWMLKKVSWCIHDSHSASQIPIQLCLVYFLENCLV